MWAITVQEDPDRLSDCQESPRVQISIVEEDSRSSASKVVIILGGPLEAFGGFRCVRSPLRGGPEHVLRQSAVRGGQMILGPHRQFLEDQLFQDVSIVVAGILRIGI